MFHFLEYPFSRGSTHITSADPYAVPDFDAGFMNDERDMVPMVWGYIKSRETARRMDAYAGEVANMHPFFSYDSPATALDMDLPTTNQYALPGNITAGIQHGSWTQPLREAERKSDAKVTVTSNQKDVRDELQYSTEDIKAIEEWVKRHVETTWHSLGVSDDSSYPSQIDVSRVKHAADNGIQINRRAPWRLGRATASSSTVC
jgi:alcohol oxidase